MPLPYHCPHGHHWVASLFEVAGPSARLPDVCPTCGRKGVVSESATTGIDDRLRPDLPETLDAPPLPPRSPETTTFPAAHHLLSDGVQPPPSSDGVKTIAASPPTDQAATQIAPVVPIPAATSHGPTMLGSFVGGYELTQLLGRGGMGVVYKARQAKLGRFVAIKMIRTADAPPEVLARFRLEAEAVAHVHHPNIVQIFEIGEHQGAPYIALEFVDGGSLADRLDGTPVAGRVAAGVVEALARAVHHAHVKGIIHRDLKPANVLLASPGAERFEFGTPKVTDFGLAKRLGDVDSQTQTGAILGTPNYMAPEQANGLKDLGPAVDTYALGCILYEMLTGRPVFLGETPLDTITQVVTADPVPPSRLNPKTPRDLETICLKCLNKHPLRRYPTAEALADDLARFRTGQSIHARPTPIAEKGWKWVRRRPTTAALVAVVFLSAVSVYGILAWSYLEVKQQRDEVKRQRDRADAGFHRALDLVGELTELEEKLPPEPELLGQHRGRLDRLRSFFDDFVAERRDDPSARVEIAQAYHRTADIARILGQHESAIGGYAKAIEAFQELAAAHPADPALAAQLADSLNWQGEAYRGVNRLTEARAAYTEAGAIQRGLTARFPDNRAYRHRLARSLYNLGIVRLNIGQLPDAKASLDESIGLLARLAEDDPGQPQYRQELARAYLNLAPVLRESKKNTEAIDRCDRSIALLEKLAEDFGDEPEYKRELAVSRVNRGNLLTGTAATMSDAVAEYLKAQRLLARLADSYPRRPTYREELANVYNSLGAAHVGPSNPDLTTAEAFWKQAEAAYRETLARFPDLPDCSGRLGITLGNLGWVAVERKDAVKARAYLEEARDRLAVALKLNEKQMTYRQSLRRATHDLVTVYLLTGDHAAAATVAAGYAAGEPASSLKLYYSASVLARCAARAAADPRLSPAERAAVARGYADDAVRLLRRVADAGRPNGKEFAKYARDFAVLQGREDYQRVAARFPAPSASPAD